MKAKDTGPLRIIIGVPSGGTWCAEFGTSLVSLVACFANSAVPGFSSHELRVANVRGSILPKQRLEILKAAKACEASHLLFIDSDQTFPADLVHRLVARGKDVVACNIATKQIPANTTARRKCADPQGESVFTDPESTGLERVWRVGTGVMLLSAKAYNQIPHGAFAMTYKPEADAYQGEDWNMCEALERAGVPIYVDHDTSKKIGHIGSLNYTHDYVGQVVSRGLD